MKMKEMEEKNLEKIESKPAFRHSIPVQMRFNDIDVLGHVNNSVFFTYYDLGKSAYFTTIRKGQMNWTRPDVVIANVNCNFYAPMRFGEPVSVVTRVESIREKSFKAHRKHCHEGGEERMRDGDGGVRRGYAGIEMPSGCVGESHLRV